LDEHEYAICEWAQKRTEPGKGWKGKSQQWKIVWHFRHFPLLNRCPEAQGRHLAFPPTENGAISPKSFNLNIAFYSVGFYQSHLF